MALYKNILVIFEVETLIKKVLGFLQTFRLNIWKTNGILLYKPQKFGWYLYSCD